MEVVTENYHVASPLCGNRLQTPLNLAHFLTHLLNPFFVFCNLLSVVWTAAKWGKAQLIFCLTDTTVVHNMVSSYGFPFTHNDGVMNAWHEPRDVWIARTLLGKSIWLCPWYMAAGKRRITRRHSCTRHFYANFFWQQCSQSVWEKKGLVCISVVSTIRYNYYYHYYYPPPNA